MKSLNIYIYIYAYNIYIKIFIIILFNFCIFNTGKILKIFNINKNKTCFDIYMY